MLLSGITFQSFAFAQTLFHVLHLGAFAEDHDAGRHCMLVPTVMRRTGCPDTHLGKSLLVIESQVKVIKRGKDCLVTPLCQQMLQLLTDGGFPRALRSAHPNKQRSVWMCLLMLLQLVVEPEIDRQVVLVDTSSANIHHSRWL